MRTSGCRFQILVHSSGPGPSEETPSGADQPVWIEDQSANQPLEKPQVSRAQGESSKPRSRRPKRPLSSIQQSTPCRQTATWLADSRLRGLENSGRKWGAGQGGEKRGRGAMGVESTLAVIGTGGP
eukprot:3971761-Pyramimonas_sp.AAC.1